MIELDGSFMVNAPPLAVYERLADLQFIAASIPDTDGEPKFEADAAELLIRPKLAFSKGEMKLRIQRVGQSMGESLAWRLSTEGIGATSELSAAMTFAEEHGDACIRWKVQVESLKGLFKLVPRTVIHAAAKKVIGDALEVLKRRLELIQTGPTA